MPQYVRENGAIRVIPDDRTTEDGEIELSQKRKIIDEGNVVIEGRDDGSTVIREKRPMDHKFFSNPQVIEEATVPQGNYDVYDVARYNSLDDTYIFLARSGSPSLYFYDPSDGTSYTVDVPSDNADAVIPLPGYDKIFVNTDQGNIRVMEKNDSTGQFEFVRSFSKTASGSSYVIPLPYLDKFIEITGGMVAFGSISNESAGSSVGDPQLLSPFQYLEYDFLTRADRIIVADNAGNSIIVNPQSSSFSQLDTNNDLFDSFVGLAYAEKTDSFITRSVQTNEFLRFDGSTLEELVRTSEAYPDNRLTYNTILEGRFVLTLASSEDGDVLLFDSKNLNILDRITKDDFSEQNANIFFDSARAGYDTKRNRLFFAGKTPNLTGDPFFTINYNPFYS